MAISAAIKTEIERKASAGIPLAGDSKGNVKAENLAYYQQLVSAQNNANNQNSSNQLTGGGVGSLGSGVGGVNVGGNSGGNFPGNTIIPGITNDAVKGYGFTAIVGLGVALVVFSLVSSFRRVRGR